MDFHNFPLKLNIEKSVIVSFNEIFNLIFLYKQGTIGQCKILYDIKSSKHINATTAGAVSQWTRTS